MLSCRIIEGGCTCIDILYGNIIYIIYVMET